MQICRPFVAGFHNPCPDGRFSFQLTFFGIVAVIILNGEFRALQPGIALGCVAVQVFVQFFQQNANRVVVRDIFYRNNNSITGYDLKLDGRCVQHISCGRRNLNDIVVCSGGKPFQPAFAILIRCDGANIFLIAVVYIKYSAFQRIAAVAVRYGGVGRGFMDFKITVRFVLPTHKRLRGLISHIVQVYRES